MTVFVEPLGDIAGLADGREVVFEIGVVRENHAGTGMVTPRRVSVSPVNGVLTTPSLDPGPARVCIAFEWFDIVIPNASESQRLWPLIEGSIEYEPPVVSLVKQYRDEAKVFRDEAEAAAGNGGGGSGVPSGGWPLSSLAQEVIDSFGGGVSLPIGFADLGTEVKSSLGKADSASQPGHKHDAIDITSGVMPVVRGGTGRNNFAANSYLRGNGEFVVQADPFATVRSNIGAVATDDSRLTDARTPKAHKHSGADVTAIIDTEDGPVEVDMDIVASTIGSMIQTLDQKATLDSPVFTGSVEAPGVKITGGSPGTGKVLTSDVAGIGSWQTPTAGGVAVGPTSVAATAEGSKGTAVGSAASAGGTAALSMGSISNASGNYSVAIGSGSTASHSTSVAVGYASATTKSSQIMLGSSNRTVAIPGKMELGSGSAEATISTRVESGVPQVVAQFPDGDPMVLAPTSGAGGISWAVSNTSNLSNATPTASAGGGMAIGYSAVSGGFDRDVAVGPRAQTGGQGSIALGDNARATGNQSLAVGRAAWASHGASSTFGAGATTTKTNQVMLGTSSQTVTMPGKAEIGEGATMVTLSTRLTAGKAELIATLPSGKIISLGIDT